MSATSMGNNFASRSVGKRKEPLLHSVITCPKCGHRTEEIMRSDSCRFFYECPNCHVTLKPVAGDCCVFCSYGSVPCPPIQIGEDCCG